MATTTSSMKSAELSATEKNAYIIRINIAFGVRDGGSWLSRVETEASSPLYSDNIKWVMFMSLYWLIVRVTQAHMYQAIIFRRLWGEMRASIPIDVVRLLMLTVGAVHVEYHQLFITLSSHPLSVCLSFTHAHTCFPIQKGWCVSYGL